MLDDNATPISEIVWQLTGMHERELMPIEKRIVDLLIEEGCITINDEGLLVEGKKC